MKKVFIGLGSNIDPQMHVAAALRDLALSFGEMGLSPIYESEAVGFEGDNFINLVVSFETDMSVKDLSVLLRKIEDGNGRDRTQPRFSARTLDIDILTYGDEVGDVDGVQLPRDEILENAFVLLPLSELAPKDVHPVTQISYAEHWGNFESDQKLWRVDLKAEAQV